MATAPSIRFAIDTGGTFTDIVVLNEISGQYRIEKASTTPENTLLGVLDAIDTAGVDLRHVSNFFVHGSTTALNAMLERKGVRTAFIATRGFRDVPEIMRYNRPQMYNPKYRKPPQIVPRELRFEVTERMDAAGNILTPLVEEEVRVLARRMREEGVKAVAVCLLHAFRNPIHEQRIRDLLLEANPEIPVALSSTVAPEHREFERGMTTILNAYLAPVVERWVGNLEQEFERRGFPGDIVLTKSDGGGMTGASAKRSPINMLLSGPAGGVIGGMHLSRITEFSNLVTMDVGGTSFDIATIKQGEAAIQQETKVNGYPVLISNLDIRTIGAGGGSIGWLDPSGALHVGPQSAGAVPGPVCYNRGGKLPTVTDAFLVTGFIEAKGLLGGRMPLDRVSAEKAIKTQVAVPLGLETIAAASGILRIAMSNMANAVKDLLSETGDDAREFGMLCFGGGGPMFGSYLMDELEMPAAIIPMVPSVFSAFGMLMIDVRHDVVETVSAPLHRIMADLESRFKALEARGFEMLADEGISPERRSMFRVAEMRYAGQEHAVTVKLDMLFTADDMSAVYKQFEDAYEAVYGYRLGHEAEVVNLRVRAVGSIPKPTLMSLAAGPPNPEAALSGQRRVYDYLELAWLDCGVYDRGRLVAGNVIAGPALIEEPTTTTVVRSGQTCQVDGYGNLIVRRT